MPGVARGRARFTASNGRVYHSPVTDNDDEYGEYKPSIREAFRNWRHWDGPFSEKAKLTAKNEWRKLRRLRDCCDHIDEPGC